MRLSLARPRWVSALLVSSLLLGGCAGLRPGGEEERIDPSGYRAEGKASYYGSRHHGRRTASGERFDQNALTAAHRTLPFGTRVRVTNLNNNRTVVVRINDRGPYGRGRIIDLSFKAAQQLDMIRPGVVPVRVESLVD
ncbi:septal ring lytic transglycosylase RlpA family protein [Pseudomonas indica]|uniref:Endolytic peptidoglycan transglycosylase RlpA n=1 Tax=Pseudomonas indica TaxID=137658 RepID=A0A1G9FJ87_9PSED|nr:septal ring lytic transglycosylase RlpA family protein [Pseudomonas indica]SDK88412.1 rare lipoprotein A [Pseudomonas indica]